jgi:signal recognition particle receptor subunit beta
VVEINHKERFLRAKILYYGPAAGGKTTSLNCLHSAARGERREELVSVNTAQDRTILFDLLPLSTPAFRSYDLRFQVVAVPGQRFYGATRKMLLKNADSIVFVANSATDRWQENLQSMKEMTEYLLDHGIEPSSIPVVFQYNKQDLPDTTDLKIMERGLNARGAPSFPSIATQGVGVLEAFGSVLENTMTELATRYKIGENFADARTAKEWTSRTMLEIFGTSLEELKEGRKPQFPDHHGPKQVFRVSAPKLSPSQSQSDSQPHAMAAEGAPIATEASSVTEDTSPSLGPPPDWELSSPAIDLPRGFDQALNDVIEGPAPPSAPPTTPTPPPPVAPPVHSAPAGAVQLDVSAANAMVESYAEAASSLADHISELRAKSEQEARRAQDFATVADVAKKLFEASVEETPVLIEGLVASLAGSLGCSQASLSLLRPDGYFEQVVGYGLQVDPLEGAKTPGGRPLAQAIVDGKKPMLQLRGEAGPLEEAMDRAGVDCVAVVAVPMRTPVHAVGLITFYLPQEAPAPKPAVLAHLERVVLELTVALEVISDAHASEALKQSFRVAFRGRVAEGAAHSLDTPLGGVEAALVRMRARPDAPEWLEPEMRHIESSVSNVKFMRQTLLDLRAGRLPGRVPTPLSDILARLEHELGPALTELGLRFVVEIKPGVRPVYAEPFLLRGLVYTLIDTARRRLVTAGGGVIRILVQPDTHGARISVFDNLIAVSNSVSAPARYLAWPLERRITEVTNEVTQGVVEYFQGRWSEETRESVGTVRTIILPTA